jgi:hypothetical protein
MTGAPCGSRVSKPLKTKFKKADPGGGSLRSHLQAHSSNEKMPQPNWSPELAGHSSRSATMASTRAARAAGT